MSSFNTNYRPNNAERMVRRAREGIAYSNYKPIDYAELKTVIAEKKLSGQESLVKLKKIETAARLRKDNNSLKQHCDIWNRELARLRALRQQTETDISSSVNDIILGDNDSLVQELYEELDLYRESLADDLSKFKSCSADPVWQLRNDLKVWIKTHNSGKSDASIELDEPQDVLATIASVKQQQEHVLRMLYAEQASLESELHIDGLIDSVVQCDTKRIQTGIPEEAFDLECPDLQLKAAVLQQFIFLDGKYVEKLNELEEQYNDVLSDLTGGWSNEDHDLFVYLFDAYARDVSSGRRLLFIDCLQRCLGHKTRADIVKHEDWWMRTKFFYQHRRDLYTGWSRDRAELLNRVKVVFNEACLSKQLEDIKLENRQKQQDFRDHLWAKVNEWRQRKMEAFRLEHELAEAARTQAALARIEEEEKEKTKRQQQKEKIKKFRDELELKRKQEEEADKQRLQELQSYLAEQAAHDRERVKFREEELMKKQDDRQKKREEQLAAAEERERVLEAIRAKVRPEVEGDLLRLWSDTQAWQARQKPEENVDIHKPLFDIKSFTSEKVMADPRVRAEQRIRDAGLQNSEYARNVLLQMQPARQPRRDMESSLFR